MKRGWGIVLAIWALSLWVGCTPDDELPRTLIVKPRVLAIKADPPAVAAGETTTVTALIVGTGAETPAVSWVRCRRAPRPGDAINPDCFDSAQADLLEPIGDGPTITTAMPADVTAEALGQPDATGGVYLPLIARVTVAGQSLLGSYRLRLATAGDVNRNPGLTGVLIVNADGVVTAIDEASPPVVRAGDQLTLQPALADGSAETYPAALGDGTATEILLSSWFSTAGRFSQERTDATQPTTVLELSEPLPAPGDAIDLYVVTRDDRGGAEYVHRTLAFGQ
jgi:hypothetical protein